MDPTRVAGLIAPTVNKLMMPSVQPFLDVRTVVLNGTLEQAFRRRHHGFGPVNDNHGLTAAA